MMNHNVAGITYLSEYADDGEMIERERERVKKLSNINDY